MPPDISMCVLAFSASSAVYTAMSPPVMNILDFDSMPSLPSVAPSERTRMVPADIVMSPVTFMPLGDEVVSSDEEFWLLPHGPRLPLVEDVPYVYIEPSVTMYILPPAMLSVPPALTPLPPLPVLLR